MNQIKKYNTYAKGINDFKENEWKILTFKEVIEARLKDSSLFETWQDSCTGIAYKKNSTKFKLIPKCKELLEIDKDFDDYFIKVNYSKLKGIELDNKKGKYDELLTKAEVMKHPAWLKLLGKPLLKKYVDIVFKDKNKAMAFWIRENTDSDELRALYVFGLGVVSGAGGFLLDNGGSFLRVAQENAKHDENFVKIKRETYNKLIEVLEELKQ